MISPPSEGAFCRPRNSIFHNTRLKAPTMGLSISSCHCGSIEPRAGARCSSFLSGNVPLLPLTRVILQRPFPIYELDMNSGNAVGAGAARANSGVRRDAILLADHTNKTTLRYLQRREDACSPGA